MVTMPEQSLIHAVIGQAIKDLFLAQTAGASETGDTERREAMAFLTDTRGPWARSRVALCMEADLDPDRVRSQVIRWLEGDAVPSLPSGRNGTLRSPAGVAAARALWHAETKEVEERARLERQAAKARRVCALAAEIKRDSDLIQTMRRNREAARLRAANAHHVQRILSHSRSGPKARQAACMSKVINVLSRGPKTEREIFYALEGEHAPETIRRVLELIGATRDGDRVALSDRAA